MACRPAAQPAAPTTSPLHATHNTDHEYYLLNSEAHDVVVVKSGTDFRDMVRAAAACPWLPRRIVAWL